MEDFSFDVKYSFLGVSISQPLEKSAAAVVTWLRQPNQKLFLSILFWTLRLTLTTVIYERPARIGQLNDLLSLQHWLSSMMQERVRWTMGSLFFFFLTNKWRLQEEKKLYRRLMLLYGGVSSSDCSKRTSSLLLWGTRGRTLYQRCHLNYISHHLWFKLDLRGSNCFALFYLPPA